MSKIQKILRIDKILEIILNKISKSSYPKTKTLAVCYKESIQTKRFLAKGKYCKIDPNDLPREFKQFTKAAAKM